MHVNPPNLWNPVTGLHQRASGNLGGALAATFIITYGTLLQGAHQRACGNLDGSSAAIAPPRLACCAPNSSVHAASSCRKAGPLPVKPRVCSTCCAGGLSSTQLGGVTSICQYWPSIWAM